MIEALQIISGLVLLYYGGETLLKGSVSIAKNYNLPTFIIGMTIVAFGTSAPEFIVSIQASIKSAYDVAVGNIIGSNVSNSFLILGISAMICTIKIYDEQIKKDMIFLLIITLIFTIFSYTANNIGQIEGVILIVILVIYTVLKIRLLKNAKQTTLNEIEKEVEAEFDEIFNTRKATIYIFLGIILLAVGGEFAVEGAVGLARIIGISEAVISLTVVAIGSSAPELASCVVAARKGHYDMIIGNVIGSNIFNIVLGLGAVAIFKPIVVSEKFLSLDIIYFVASAFIMFLCARLYSKLDRYIGLIFVFIYASFVLLQFN